MFCRHFSNASQSGYGYAEDPSRARSLKPGAAADEGIWRTDLKTGEMTLLVSLEQAWEVLPDSDKKRFESAAGRRIAARSQSYFDQQVREFERVQRAHAGKQELKAQMAENQTTLKLLKEERRYRAAEADKVALFFKRLLTL